MTDMATGAQAARVSFITGIAPLSVGDAEDDLHAAAQARCLSEIFTPGRVSYTILDGAEILNLPERLETSGLDHASLFQGDAEEDLAEVAPYLVALDPDNRVARGLFTRSDAPWHLWDDDAVVVFQSDKTLDDVRAHFRRFTKVQAEDGSWAYFRFWLPQTMQGLRHVIQHDPDRVHALFSDCVRRIVFKLPGRDQLMDITPLTVARGSPRHLAPDADIHAALTRHLRPAQVLKLQRHTEARLRQHDPKSFAQLHALGRAARFGHAKRLYRMGLRDPHLCAMLVSIICATGLDILREPAFHYATRNPLLSPAAKARQLIMAFRMIDKMKET